MDDEDELTYYEVRVQDLAPSGSRPNAARRCRPPSLGPALAHLPPGTPLEEDWYGKRLTRNSCSSADRGRSALLRRQCLTITRDGEPMTTEQFLNVAAEGRQIREKEQVFSDLRDKGYIPRTGYKFGHHYRVYSGKKTHSEMLAHAIAPGASIPMSAVSRSVRLAHSVKKKMLFACIYNTDIRYVEFARIKL